MPFFRPTITLLLLLLLGLLFGLLPSCKPTQADKFYQLTVQDMQGNTVLLANELKGKTVVLNFWATWCPPCRQEKPELEKARTLLEQEGIEFICLSDEKTATIQKYRSLHPDGLTYYKLNNSVKWLGIFEIPQTFVINPNGKVVFQHTGYNQWSSPETLDIIRAAKTTF